jgi:hypothetical protein
MGESTERELREAYRDPGLSLQRERTGETGQDAAELQYFPEGGRHTSSVAAYYALLLPLFAGMGAAMLTQSAGVGLLAALATAGWKYWQRRRARTTPRAVLRVLHGRLHLSGPAFPAPIACDLSELLDVYLDTKTIQRVQENAGAVPDLRFINATVGGEQDTARIALELERETFFLTPERLSHTDANEWFGKIRRFLRQHGWVPEDERAATKN